MNMWKVAGALLLIGGLVVCSAGAADTLSPEKQSDQNIIVLHFENKDTGKSFEIATKAGQRNLISDSSLGVAYGVTLTDAGAPEAYLLEVSKMPIGEANKFRKSGVVASLLSQFSSTLNLGGQPVTTEDGKYSIAARQSTIDLFKGEDSRSAAQDMCALASSSRAGTTKVKANGECCVTCGGLTVCGACVNHDCGTCCAKTP